MNASSDIPAQFRLGLLNIQDFESGWLSLRSAIVGVFIPRGSPAAAAAKSLQSCPTLCDPIDGSAPGFSVPGILQAGTLEWVAISFSHAWQWKVKVKSLSCVQLVATPWIAAYQSPPSMGFSRQEYWSGMPSLDTTNQGFLFYSETCFNSIALDAHFIMCK